MRSLLAVLLVLLAFLPARAEHDGKLQILLLGDSTTEASVPKMLFPKEPQLENIVDLLLAGEGDLPPTNTINSGVSGGTLRRLIDSGRYDKAVSKLPGIDYIFIRYGLNDHSKRENFEASFPNDFHELIARLRADHPQAIIYPTLVIPYKDPLVTKLINGLIQDVSAKEKLTVFDLHTRYAAELKASGPNALNYRRYKLENIPEKLHPLVKAYVNPARKEVVVDDQRLDAHFAKLPGWFSDRHPNSAGYHVIASETAKFLAPIIRARTAKPKP